MKTKLLVLAGLAAMTAVLILMSMSAGTAGAAAKAPKADAAKAPSGPYDPTTQQGYRAAEIQKMEAALPTEAYAKPAKPRKLLVYVESKGFYHDSIPLIAATLKAMGDKTGAWETTYANDPAVFTAENLAKYDGVFMDNTVTESPSSEEGRKALLDYVKSGKGFMGCHAGADCNHKWAEYADLIGGEFVGHVWGEPKASVRNEDPTHPLCVMFPKEGFTDQEEYYTFGKPTQQKPQGYSRDKVHVLLSIDCPTSKLDPNKGQQKDGDYALSWIKKYGDGRVFYTAYGHRHEQFWSAPILKHFLAGIQYALGDLKADDTPSGKKDWKSISGPAIDTPVINPVK